MFPVMIALFIPVFRETLEGLAFASSLGGPGGGTAALLPTMLGGAASRIKNDLGAGHHWLDANSVELIQSGL